MSSVDPFKSSGATGQPKEIAANQSDAAGKHPVSWDYMPPSSISSPAIVRHLSYWTANADADVSKEEFKKFVESFTAALSEYTGSEYVLDEYPRSRSVRFTFDWPVPPKEGAEPSSVKFPVEMSMERHQEDFTISAAIGCNCRLLAIRLRNIRAY